MMQNFCKSFFIFIFLLTVLVPKDSYADNETGIGRARTCSAGSGEVEGLEFNPTSGGKDVEFVMTNDVCLGVVIGAYAAVKIAITNMNWQCGNKTPIRYTPSIFSDIIDVAKCTPKCSTTSPACCTAIGLVGVAMAGFLAFLGVQYGIADTVFKNTSVCGANWMKPSVTNYDFSAGDYKAWVQSNIDTYVRDQNTSSDGLSLNNQTYREWLYNGVEYDDNPYSGTVCYDPTKGTSSKDKWGKYPRQKYYLKGTEAGNYNCKRYLLLPGQEVKTGVNWSDMKTAYECCLDRSQNYMCLDYTNVAAVDTKAADGVNYIQKKNTPTFCKKNEQCKMMLPSYVDRITDVSVPQVENGGVRFETQSEDSGGTLLCAKTYSLCPYNFNIGGGSDFCDFYRDGIWNSNQNRWTIITQEQIDAGQCSSNSEIRNPDCTYNSKAGKCKNYCQYLVHCTKTAMITSPYQSGLGSPYFAQACLDFIGDSQNNSAFDTGIIMGKQTHFTAPIAQCIKESLENLFYNRAGHSKCLKYDEYPSSDGTCESGLYALTSGNLKYKKGEKVKESSFFQQIQNMMHLVVKMGITLAVVFYGINILLGKANLGDKKSILVFIFKIALVMYFCVGTAWQDIFFRGFYDSSMAFANMLFKIETLQNPLQRDGCQFGKVSLSDGTQEIVSTYPSGKEYLAIWDTIDCKMMRYLGFGPQMTNANIASMVFAAWLIGPIGIYFALSVMIFGFFLVSLGIRALHIFISSAAAIIILIFVSPLIIPCGMFEKTKGIFEGWLGKLMSFCLQPMILFAYVAVFIMVMDQTLIGSATFHGKAPTKTMSCSRICVGGDGVVVPYVNDQEPECKKEDKQEFINPLDDSVACLLNFQGFSQWHAFEMIGVALPALTNLFSENPKQRILTMLKGALVMYLLYVFMDEIPGIIEALVGGGVKGGPSANAVGMLTKSMGAAAGAATRLASLGGKVGGSTRSTISTIAHMKFGEGKKEMGDASSGEDPSAVKGNRGQGGDNAQKERGGAAAASGSDNTGKAGSAAASGSDNTEKAGIAEASEDGKKKSD
jgi:type IV secretory pathway VirB6-like protein